MWIHSCLVLVYQMWLWSHKHWVCCCIQSIQRATQLPPYPHNHHPAITTTHVTHMLTYSLTAVWRRMAGSIVWLYKLRTSSARELLA